jgi:UDP-N-acetylglucosamine transferase subunit ALG13
MIFVTVGNHPASFNRLLQKVDELAEQGIIKEVFAQTGFSDYLPIHYKHTPFIGYYEFDELIKQCRFIITHGGAGCIGNALLNHKPTIVVPRYKKFGEHTNDHQLEITRELEKADKIIAVYEIDKLGEAIEKAESFKVEIHSDLTAINNLIQEHIESWL